MNIIAILKELGLPLLGIAGMLIVYYLSNRRMEQRMDAIMEEVKTIVRKENN